MVISWSKASLRKKKKSYYCVINIHRVELVEHQLGKLICHMRWWFGLLVVELPFILDFLLPVGQVLALSVILYGSSKHLSGKFSPQQLRVSDDSMSSLSNPEFRKVHQYITWEVVCHWDNLVPPVLAVVVQSLLLAYSMLVHFLCSMLTPTNWLFSSTWTCSYLSSPYRI